MPTIEEIYEMYTIVASENIITNIILMGIISIEYIAYGMLIDIIAYVNENATCLWDEMSKAKK